MSEWYEVAQGVGALVSSLALFGILKQLAQANRANRLSAINVLGATETQILAHYQDLCRKTNELQGLLAQRDSEASPVLDASIAKAEDEQSLSKELFLNALDRFCHNVLIGVFPARELRDEYEPFLRTIVSLIPELWREPCLPQRNIIRLHRRWAQHPKLPKADPYD